MAAMFSYISALVLLFSNFFCVLAVKPSPGCGKSTTFGGNRTTTVNGKQRWYLVKTPDNYNNTRPHRLIFTFHGLADSGATVANGQKSYLPYYGLPPLANDDIGAIFIAPTGLNTGWANTGGEDLLFVDDMMKSVEDNLCIDQDLRFSTGFSYGGAMSYAIACSRAKQFRAVAVLSGGLLSGCTGGRDPIAYYGQHGLGDPLLPIAQGRSMRDTFVRNNGCTAQTPQEPRSGQGTMVKTKYGGCNEGYPVTWIAFDGSHIQTPVLRGETQTFAAVETWEFFKQFR
ncbi:alpha/beta-hydrolase [Podospora aff. communis PSN243]|uniref:Feruloyl esterase C n=1 Tax=Podospora aff. communis PSN243 TaxID=3040156 RepID=A0AAV9G4W1_9PEZI|nr:alpha/beta-hydrolase [Podospora aff. communis PSN243]